MAKQQATPKPTVDPEEEQLLKELEEAIRDVNDSDRGVAYRMPKMVAIINKDRFWVKFRGAEEAEAKYESMTVQILASAMPRAFYTGKEDKVPTCSSVDGFAGRVNPDLSHRLPEDFPSEQQCAACRFNMWGTALSAEGKPTRGKACNEMRALLILHPDFQEPIILRLSPTSISAWDTYAAGLALRRKGGGRPSSYIEWLTKITVKVVRDDNGNEYGVATFEAEEQMNAAVVLSMIQTRRELLPMLEVPLLMERTETTGAANEDKVVDAEVFGQPPAPF